MASIGQIYYLIFDTTGEGNYHYISNITEELLFGLDANIVALYGSLFTKIGILAPPGTLVEINDKTIMVGRTGIYELTDIVITKMRFVKTRDYEKNEEKSNEAIIDGALGMQAAEIERDNSLADLGTLSDTPTVELARQYGLSFSSVLSNFDSAYLQALARYNKGYYGVYTLVGTKPVYNIIVDFLYE